ncbi:hypothetical protein [Halorhodospira halochloris]|uniref:hypothetical protein n=1 Tax=Halorhodospira halochloris TaxID=1052 RepID=UPI001EE7CA88|nr:hypothetical protein [Halorhodospira halochloris]MCG5547535.1 hypothetical protein [Halorhodospira halochloris]
MLLVKQSLGSSSAIEEGFGVAQLCGVVSDSCLQWAVSDGDYADRARGSGGD